MSNSRESTAIKFGEAFEIVMDSAGPSGVEHVGIENALNRILAQDIVSTIDVPPFDKSTMDGFACRRGDLKNELEVIESIPAGVLPEKTIGENRCARIMTGAIVPEGADCVIIKEETEIVSEKSIRYTGSGKENYIRFKGEDVKRGDTVLRKGQLLKAQHVAVLATHGCVEPLVAIRPRVGIIATGSELVEPSRKPAAGQIRNSNGYQLTAHVGGTGAVPVNYGIAPDEREATGIMLKRALSENDVVILSGGVSVGDYDLVRDVLKERGVRLVFERIAVKPGRPMVFGILDSEVSPGAGEPKSADRVICFGLPGNPVSTFVTFELLVKPFLYKLMGHDFKPAVSYRQLGRTIERERNERDSWMPVVFDRNGKAVTVEYHGSAHINALCEADGLICAPSGVAKIEEGTSVAVRQIQ